MELVEEMVGDYERYEDLLLRRDEFEKEAEYILLEYMRIFGEITTEIFQLKIDCIALKKAIAYCIKAQNRGESVAPEKIQKFMEETLLVYQAELEEMVRQNQIAKTSKKISAFQTNEIKRIYRKIAKVLHPDISNFTKEYPGLEQLFQRVIIAYHCNNYKEMKELEVLVCGALEEIGQEKFQLIIPDLEEKIHELEEEIRQIITIEPYIYKELLKDSDKIQEKKKEFQEERDTYANYKIKLEEQLKEIQVNGK